MRAMVDTLRSTAFWTFANEDRICDACAVIVTYQVSAFKPICLIL